MNIVLGSDLREGMGRELKIGEKMELLKELGVI
jgi:hypothetical protein